ncbi:MAG TPA: hypothetical protein VGU66_18695 [Candidatus Elarobacter sp.]|nr:hypothetical protein [Candidatus Elarobacter sp.]
MTATRDDTSSGVRLRGAVRAFAPALAALALLCGCGGGGGGGAAVRVPPPVVTPTPATGPASVDFTILVPRATSAFRRRPAYVSTLTQSVRLTVNGGTPVVANVTSGSPNCTDGASGRSCTVHAQAAAGAATIVVQLYGQPDGQGPILSQGTTSANLSAGTSNPISLTLNGVVARIVLALGTPAPPQGTAATIPLTVTAYDAAGAAIVGDPFASPITLTDSDTSGATSISKTVIAAPSDAANLTVSYSGAAIGSATFGATASGVSSGSVTPATLSPQAGGPAAFVDWTTYGFDNHRDGFNPSSTALTPSALSGLHLAWQQLGYGGDYNVQSQPILATNVGSHAGLLFVGGALGVVYAFDALTGSQAWSNALDVAQFQCYSGGSFQLGIGGTAAYDPASRTLYVSDNKNASINGPSSAAIVRLDAVTGSRVGHVDVVSGVLPGQIDAVHTAVTLANGLVYAGTSSTCDYSSWRGRVATAPADMSGPATIFYTAYGRGGNFSGGGVWGWGGVSVDDGGAVYAGVGNTDTGQGATGPQPPFVQTTAENAGYGDHLIKLSPDGGSLLAANDPGYTFGNGTDDVDFEGTPVLFKPVGCTDTLAASHGKDGLLIVYDTANIGAGPIARYRTSPSTSEGVDLSSPAFSPLTGLLYVTVATNAGGSIDPAGIIALRPTGCNAATAFSVAWHTAFGPDSFTGSNIVVRSSPTVTAGGVLLVGTPCTPDGSGGCQAIIGAQFGGALWALDARDGTILNSGKPVLRTADHIRAPATVDGKWVYVTDVSADLYGLTLDPAFKAIQSKQRTIVRRPSWYQMRRPH